jgi:hypothetical protein
MINKEKTMRKLIPIMVVFSILTSCSPKGPNQIAQRMHRVENGLVEIKSPADMLRLDSTQLANAKTIMERMEYYKVPGVSIAVINDDRIEWTKVYGAMDVNSPPVIYASSGNADNKFQYNRCRIPNPYRCAQRRAPSRK